MPSKTKKRSITSFELSRFLLLGMLLLCSSLAAKDSMILSDEFVAYHIGVANEEIEDEEIFYLIEELVDGLNHAGTSNYSAKELINLIEEGHKIDPFNMAKLIALLKMANASNNATWVIVTAIEHDSPITTDHMISLIETLAHANASNNATTIILKAIEHGVPFGPKERLKLAEVSKIANARSNVEKIRKALHEREVNS